MLTAENLAVLRGERAPAVAAAGLEDHGGALQRGLGEVRPGDPRLFAFGLMGPMVLSMVWRETFVPVGAEPVDVVKLADQHLDTVLKGMRP